MWGWVETESVAEGSYKADERRALRYSIAPSMVQYQLWYAGIIRNVSEDEVMRGNDALFRRMVWI